MSALPAGSSCLSEGDIHVHEGFENGSPLKSVLSGRQGGGKRGKGLDTILPSSGVRFRGLTGECSDRG